MCAASNHSKENSPMKAQSRTASDSILPDGLEVMLSCYPTKLLANGGLRDALNAIPLPPVLLAWLPFASQFRPLLNIANSTKFGLLSANRYARLHRETQSNGI
ncbi:hypothetical protein ACEPAF_9013 [Sanghuangporus sanghuang]